MSILGVQIIAILFASFMGYIVFLHWKKRDITRTEAFFWTILWLAFALIALFPNVLQNLTRLLFFARIMDLLMVSAFMILAFIGFQNYFANKRMEKKIEEFIRKEAIKEISPKGKK